jgi:hypothetical protein
MRVLLNLGSSRIELLKGSYKLGGVTNEVFAVPHKQEPRPPFIVR